MPNYITLHLKPQPGIQRDSTVYDSDSYVDGKWTRFYRGKPRKIGGERTLKLGNGNIIRNMFATLDGNYTKVHMGQAGAFSVVAVDFNGNTGALTDRTPETDFIPSEYNQWSMDGLNTIDADGFPLDYIVAQAAPNLLDITSTSKGPIYYGFLDSNDPLEPCIDPDIGGGGLIGCSGGVVALPPVLVGLDRGRLIFTTQVASGTAGAGLISGPGSWSEGGVLNSAVVGSGNLIKAFRARGSDPTLLVWSVSGLYSSSYVEVDGKFTFFSQLLEPSLTVLSPNCIVSYNQQYFWVGTDQFYMYNGIVQQLPNDTNLDFFFDSINPKYRAKTFAFVNPRYSEIWWCFVRRLENVSEANQPTEPNHAVIYNLKEAKWYDTPYEKASAVSATTAFPFPITASSTPVTVSDTTYYPLWQSENGLNRVINNESYPIHAEFQTNYFDLFTDNPQNDIRMIVRRFCPDFIMQGNMSVSVYTRLFPQSEDTIFGPFTFDGDTTHLDNVLCQGRLVSLKFESDSLGGYYQMGSPLLSYDPGDKDQ